MTRQYCYFPGCSHESAAGYAQSLEAVSRAVGLELQELPGWQCCGASTFFSLDGFEAVLRVGHALALAQREGAKRIVTGCNGCYSTLRKGRKILLTDSAMLDRVRQELNTQGLVLESPAPIEHLLDVLARDVTDEAWKQARRQGPGTEVLQDRLAVASYYGCLFSRGPDSSDDPQHPTKLDELLRRLDFKVVEHGAKTACCGASHMLAHGQSTKELVRRIIQTMQGQGATVAATICPLCQFNLDSGQRGLAGKPLPVLFVTQLVGLSLGLSPAKLGLDKLLVRIETE